MPGTLLGWGSNEWLLCLQILPHVPMWPGLATESVTMEYNKI